MKRFYQAVLIVSTLAFSWLAMQVAHEFGHVLHLWLSGGKLAEVVLHPLSISRTDYAWNEHELFVAWGGGLWGCLIPPAVLGAVRLAAPKYAYLAAWFAGFCLICNGAYLAVGSFSSGLDDGGLILRHGGARWQLILFGLVTAPLGLWLLNGLGPKFGLGLARGQVDRRAAVGVAVALVVLIAIEVTFSG